MMNNYVPIKTMVHRIGIVETRLQPNGIRILTVLQVAIGLVLLIWNILTTWSFNTLLFLILYRINMNIGLFILTLVIRREVWENQDPNYLVYHHLLWLAVVIISLPELTLSMYCFSVIGVVLTLTNYIPYILYDYRIAIQTNVRFLGEIFWRSSICYHHSTPTNPNRKKLKGN